FERMKRILRIGRIALRGMRTRNTGAGIFWELPLGMLQTAKQTSLSNNKKKTGPGEEEPDRHTERSRVIS
ncbi:MAG TPA: hypothetical protein VGO75_01230, partial [Gemmatimonadaceae bacterium]|nr:hypothetical protein [Gemmatimonadaceae bacterium]